jgi:Arc/MetJ-type ribon-helix-helix transcriptional regulator
MTVQLIARVDNDLLLGVDSLINLGVASNRSEVVRIALTELIERTHQAEVERRMIAAYRAQPQNEAEADRAHAAALRMIAAEPW